MAEKLQMRVFLKSGAVAEVDVTEGVAVKLRPASPYVEELIFPWPDDWRERLAFIDLREVAAITVRREGVDTRTLGEEPEVPPPGPERLVTMP